MRWQGIICAATALTGALAFIGCGDEPVEPRPMPGTTLAKSAPPISGGTLLRIPDPAAAYEGDGDDLYVASDPDTDQIHFVRFEASSLESIDLELGAEPGRLVTGDGKVFVALRGAGEVLSIDLETGARARLAVCPAPRGIAYHEGTVHVACAGGELVSMSSALDAYTRKLRLGRDLRDVVVQPDGSLAVTVFRSAEVLMIDAEGVEQRRLKATVSAVDSTFEPAVAWRTIPLGGGQLLMLHQRGLVGDVPIDPEPSAPPQSSPYGGTNDTGCGSSGILHAGATVFDPVYGSFNEVGPVLGPIVLPVDIAVSPSGSHFAAVGAGSGVMVHGQLERLSQIDFPIFDCPQQQGVPIGGEPVAIALANQNLAVVQRRQPAGLVMIDLVGGASLHEVGFNGPSRRDIGHMFFHQAASPTSALACASCHPEGREDGRVWHFAELGARRTQNLAGGVLDTMPLHWDGDLKDLGHLMSEVFVERMGGITPSTAQIDSLESWMQSIPLLPASDAADSAAVSRGEALFHDQLVGCADCHSGEKLTNHQTVAVGTGKAFQVPSLVGIADRAPFMHDGCAPTLIDRFDDPQCGGGDLHGVTSHLSAAELGDLVAYLETL